MIKKKRKYRSISRAKNTKIEKLYYIIISISIIMIIVGFAFIELGINSKNNITPEYSYTIQKSHSSEAVLKPNDFYTTQTILSDGYYASKSIDTFKINFKYDFNANKKTDIKYNYNVNSNLVATAKNIENQDKEIWNRSFAIKEQKNNEQFDIENFSINEDASINYEYYNNLVRSYERQYGITVEAVLKVYLNVFYSINEPNTDEIQDCIELDIPVTNTITNVQKNYDKDKYTEIISNKITISEIIYYTIGALLILGAIAVIIINIIKRKSKMTNKDKYRHNIYTILKYYREIIITVINEPDLTNLKTMDILILADLIDVAQQNQKNIIMYETVENEQSNLYVIVDSYVYIYKVTSEKLK